MDWTPIILTAMLTGAMFIPLEWLGMYMFARFAFGIDILAKQKGKEGLYWGMTNFNKFGRNIGGFEVSIDEIVGKASSTKTEFDLDALRKQYEQLKIDYDILLMERDKRLKRKQKQKKGIFE